MGTAPPLCTNCKHHVTQREYEICALRAQKVNPVDGWVADHYYTERISCYCSNERSYWLPFAVLFRTCGQAGRYFESKLPPKPNKA